MALTTATLTGPTQGRVGLASTNFTVTLNQAAGSGGVACTITDSVNNSEITSTPFTIAFHDSVGTFTVTAATSGARSIALASTSPALTLAGTPITYTGVYATIRKIGCGASD